MSVIIVDDIAKPREDARRALEQILGEQEIHEFDNGEDALEYFIQHQDEVDLVVTDILMQGMNGIELTRQVLGYKELPVLLHTGTWSKTYLYEMVFNGALKQNPIEIAQKMCYFDSFEEYKAAFKKQLEDAQEKQRENGVNLELLDNSIDRFTNMRDHLVDYVKNVYKMVG